jgi:hypothetical protein
LVLLWQYTKDLTQIIVIFKKEVVLGHITTKQISAQHFFGLSSDFPVVNKTEKNRI